MMKEMPKECRNGFTNPLNQHVDYELEEHFINGKQKKWKKVIEWILTMCGWFLLLSYIGYLIYGSLALKFDWYLPEFKVYTRQMIIEVQRYFYLIFIVLLIVIALMIIWKNYNKQKYGKLHRRHFKEPVTNEELCDVFDLDMEMIERMQQDRLIVLPKNIIPKQMGIGREKEDDRKEMRDAAK